MANIIAGLGAQLGLDTTEFRKGIAEAKESISELKENFVKLLEVTAFIELTKQAMEFSNQIVATAKANDLAVASVLELSAALEENGGSAEDTGKIFSGFTQKIEAAAQGNAKAQESFARLGVSLKDLRDLSEQDLFEKTVTGLAKMKDAAERNGLAVATLGKGIRGVDIKGLSESLEEGKGSMDRYADSVAKAHELSLKLDHAAKEFTLNFTNAVIPALLQFYDAMKKDGEIMSIFYEALRITAETVVVLGNRIVGTFQSVWMEIAHTAENAKLIFTGHIQEAIEANKKYEEETKAMAQRIADFEEKVLAPRKPEDVKRGDPSIHREVTLSNAKQIEAAKALILQYQNQADLTLLTLKNKEATTQMTAKEKEIQDEINKVLEANVKAVDAIKTKIATVDTSTAAGKGLKAELEKQRTLIEMQADFYVSATRRTVEENQKLRESFTYGWDEAFRQYKENAMTAADFGRQAFTSVVSTMDSALSNFVKTGKLNFSSLTQSIIQDLLTVQLRMQTMQLFSGFGFGSASFAGLMGGAQYTPGSNSFVGPMPQYADGGDPAVGQVSLVGERGPELFIPKTAGTIIPNNKLSGMGGSSSTTVNNYNIHAIDTQSFEQRLYQSSGAIWAANQYATKNVATNRSRT